MQKELLSSADVADVLGVTQEAVKRMLREGRVPALKVANRWIVARRDLKRFAQDYVKGPGRRPMSVSD